MIGLKDTIEMMLSEDYKERFKAEYYQVKIRRDRLRKMCESWDKNELSFTPTCARGTYDEQLKAMNDYIHILEARAITEGVQL